MAITLRQESATGATTKGSALTYSELDNNFIHLLRQGSVTVRGDSGTDQTLGEADKDSILQITGGTDISTAISSDSAGETVLTITYTGTATGISEIVAGTGISISQPDSAGAVTITNTVSDTDTNTTYSINAAVDGSNLNFNLAGSDASTDTIQFVAGSNITLTTDSAGSITIAATDTGIANVVEDTTPQLGGNLDCQGYEIQNPTLEDYKETIYSLGSTDSPTVTISNGNVQSVTISSGLSLPAFSDAAAGQSVTLLVTGSGTASGTAAYKFAGGNTTLTSYSVVSVFYDGTTYWASIATDFQ